MASIRFGYGLRPGEQPADSAEALIRQVRAGVAEKPRFPREGVTGRRETLGKMLSVRAAEAKASKAGKPNRDIRKETQRDAERIYQRDAMARISQAVHSPHGFYERLTSFWVDHFSTSIRKSFPMRLLVPLHEVEAIRPHLGGSFRTLLRQAVLHPAMLIYLDQNRSVGPESVAAQRNGRGLNENLGRELLELHTMGAGAAYTQDDVRAAALVLTGLTVDGRSMEVAYRRRLAEPGGITLLGKTYDEADGPNDHLAMLDDLAAHPDTAQHICRKLVAHFIDDTPPPEVVDTMVTAWTETDGDLLAVYRAMLGHPRAWTNEGAKMKQPFDFVVSGLRALNLPDKEFSALIASLEEDSGETPTMPVEGKGAARRKPGIARALSVGALRRMGQPVWQPPSPAGFPDTVAAWLSPSQLSERIGWARMAARTFGRGLEPNDLVVAALADAARPDTIKVVGQAPNKVHGLTMVLVSPEFNRR